jgi:Predicted nucleoside-diphosphate sugar epimerases
MDKRDTSNTSLRFDASHRENLSWISALAKDYLSNRYVLIFLHALTFCAVYALAFALRYDLDFYEKAPSVFSPFCQTIFWVILVKMVIFHVRSHFDNVWYYATARDLQQLIVTSFLAAVAVYAFLAFTGHSRNVSRAIPLLDFIMTIVALGGCKLLLRTIREDINPKLSSNTNQKNTLLIGANHEGGKLAHSILSYPELNYKIIGFVTIHEEKLHRHVGNFRVLGHIKDIETVAKKHHVSEVLLVAGILKGTELRELMKRCNAAKLNLRIVPEIENRLGGQTVPIRDINIDDLLKRDPIRLDSAIIRELVSDRRVLVTGAGGSIGSEICRQLLAFHPENLVILGRGENRIFFLERELRKYDTSAQITPVIADVTNEERMQAIFDKHRPEVVFHAAAHKHVPLMEANVPEAIRNNILGTKIVADLADEYATKTFVLVSTDKAVNPTSIMGTSKHMAERYVHAMSQESTTRFIVTRFGNVLGSAGSVVPLFKEQIQQGGPITITDERMTRFFMTIPEASQLVLQAASMGKGGEIFVLDMGEPVRIVDLARDMIQLAGLSKNAIEIKFSGLRPGEKLYEELYFDSEETLKTSHPKLRAAQHRPFFVDEVRYQIERLRLMLDAPEESIRQQLREFVPEYQPFQEKQLTVG